MNESEKIINLLENILLELKNNNSTNETENFLSRKQAAEFLKCDLTSLWLWTKKGKLQSYGIGGSVFYKHSELERAMFAKKKPKLKTT
ncbi:Helix-turn-helix domain containing protein [uncultured Caudovirales phage]|uniref:Helix-turn-helix domain containing protein n=1 Tax=uncultured Caudovirales phage TaxID=2100421 RepID=A0A6J5S5Z1_9CAUD|nr:Helix-turn-helix domain containing protein [uncultured Caudovirales phage]